MKVLAIRGKRSRSELGVSVGLDSLGVVTETVTETETEFLFF